MILRGSSDYTRWGGLIAVPCKNCGLPFVSEWGSNSRGCCSRPCRSEMDWVRKLGRTMLSRRPVIKATIFQRDNWICGICKLAIDRTLAWPDSRSASLDHIIPLSWGGEHVPENTQAAHLGCNTSKGNRPFKKSASVI